MDSRKIRQRKEVVEEARKVQEEAETPRDVHWLSKQSSRQNGHKALEKKALFCRRSICSVSHEGELLENKKGTFASATIKKRLIIMLLDF